MIAHLRGQILSKTPNSVILDCNGVGYELAISVTTFTELGNEGAEAKLYVHTHVREDALALFGFSDEGGRAAFRALGPDEWAACAPSLDRGGLPVRELVRRRPISRRSGWRPCERSRGRST